MRHARETILALAPEGFKISLSTCFNYTQNNREGTYQARRHHSGRGINACLSLHKPPRIGVEQFVTNLHWSTQNVNLTLDMAHSFPNEILNDSKDAKAKINADVSPVQKPGKSWRKIILPDHDWNRPAPNAITPMSHLFIQTDLTLKDQTEQNLVYSVRRTGAAATLLNISYFEPKTDIAKLSIYKLKEILRFHSVLDCGTKDEVAVRVGMVRGGRKYLSFHRELEAIRNLIKVSATLQDCPRADRCSVSSFYKNPYKPYIF